MSRTKTYRRWTAEEVEYLHQNYAALTAEQIAEALSRTADSVWEKAVREGLVKRGKRNETPLVETSEQGS